MTDLLFFLSGYAAGLATVAGLRLLASHSAQRRLDAEVARILRRGGR